MRALLLLCLLISTGTGLASAQSETALAVGTRVRWMEKQGWVEGDVQHAPVPGEPIAVQITGGIGIYDQRSRRGTLETIPWDASELQLRTRKANRWGGALVGGLIGMAVGAGIGLADGDDPAGIFTFSAEQKAVAAGTMVGLLGALFGAIAAPGPQWQSVATGSDTRVGWHVGAQGVGLRASF